MHRARQHIITVQLLFNWHQIVFCYSERTKKIRVLAMAFLRFGNSFSILLCKVCMYGVQQYHQLHGGI